MTTSAAPSHRSYSQVRSLRTCSYQYKLERIDRLPQRPNVTAVAGNVIHTVTELIDTEIHNGNRDMEGLALQGRAAADTELAAKVGVNSVYYPPEEWKRYGRATKEWPNAQDLSWFEKVGIPNAVDAYLNFRLTEHPELSLYELEGFGPAIEVPFSLFLTAKDGRVIEIVGYIDRIMQTKDGQLYLLDLKSGRKPETDEQLALYRQALLETDHDVRWGGYVYALKTGTAKLTPPIDLSHWSKDQIETIYCTADYQISQGVYIPHPGDSCFHCSVAEHCEFNAAVI